MRPATFPAHCDGVASTSVALPPAPPLSHPALPPLTRITSPQENLCYYPLQTSKPSLPPPPSRFFLSLEDNLFRIFGGDKIKNLMVAFRVEVRGRVGQ